MAERMAANPAESVHQMRVLAKMLHEMPPHESVLLSRPEWNRATLWSSTAVFENLAPNQDDTQLVRSQRDLWLRGVAIQVVPQLPLLPPNGETLTDQILGSRLIAAMQPGTTNFRQFVEWTLRLDGDLGFFSTGQSGEAFINAMGAGGDGERSMPMDWRLWTNQHIEVTVRNVTQRLFGPLVEEEAAAGFPLRAVYVTFWGLEIGGLRPGVGRWAGTSV